MRCRAIGWVTILTAFLACSSESKIGADCDNQGSTDGCESGGVCGKNAAGTVVCLKICSEQTQCAEDEECNGVEATNIKGCRKKSVSVAPATDAGADGGKK